MRKIFLLAACVFFALAPLSYHPDTKLVLYYASLEDGRVWNIYKYLEENHNEAPAFHYPPIHYWALKLEYPLVKLIGGEGIDNWLGMGSNRAFEDDKIYLFNLASKTPLVLLVLAAGLIIGKILIKNGYGGKAAKAAMLIWYFNPITLYSAIIMGQNDILALFPFIIGLWFYYDRPMIAFAFFGLAGSIKSYPLIWAMMMALSYPKTAWLKKTVYALIPLVVYIGSMLPFFRVSSFAQEVIYSGLSVRMFESAIDIGLGDKILLVPTLLALILTIVIKRDLSNNLESLLMWLTAATLSILGFTHFHPQWFLWLMPFASVYLAIRKEWWWFVLMVPAILGVILLFEDKYLYWGLISPINPSVVNLPYLAEYLGGKGIDVGLANNLCHSLIAGLSLYWIFKLTNKKDEIKG